MEKTLQILRTALDIEHKAHGFYLAASEKADDPVVRSIFSALSHDEDQHEAVISRYYQALEKGQNWPHPNDDFLHEKPDTSRLGVLMGLISSIKSHPSTFLSTYKVALEFELKTRDYYANQALSVEDSGARAFLRFLATLEDTHVAMLQTLLDSTEKALGNTD